ncbi:hypothetical protein GCM10008111_17280 [Alishewanella tabrizica]|uniref:Lipoprotein n=1 Tax=Alishewanella tabrizica TaxID=671278 RepID=A0ABQ2WKW0_9ALTE|nr:hypothetical protein GCM10008111_17280 [Alishewanella tabrizica]
MGFLSYLLLGLLGCSQPAVWQSGEIIHVPLHTLRPTQPAVAHDQIAANLARYRIDKDALFTELCASAGRGKLRAFSAQSQPKQEHSYQCEHARPQPAYATKINPVVLGPDQQLYLIDGHHTFSTFMDMPEGGSELLVTVRLQQVYHDISLAEFWQHMQANAHTWLFDEQGQAISYQALPTQLGRKHLANDPFRAAMFFLRGGVWQKPKPAIPFVEFYWAQYLKAQPQLAFPGYSDAATYTQWLERLAQHLSALSPDTLIHGQFTAAQLGLIPTQKLSFTAHLLCQPKQDGAVLGRLGLALQEQGMVINCAKALN